MSARRGIVLTAPADADPASSCGGCNHSPAYHDGDGGRPCRAWNPDEADTFCACPGWSAPKPPPAPEAAP